MKRYGNVKTNLSLSDKALAVYTGTDPMSIYEHADGVYSIESAIIMADGLTAEQVNQELESFFDEYFNDMD